MSSRLRGTAWPLRLGLVVLVLLAVLGAAALGVRGWLQSPLALDAPRVLVLPPGGSVSALVHGLGREGVVRHPAWLVRWAELTGLARAARAGEYRLAPGTSHAGLLELLAHGAQLQRSLTFVEGQTFASLRRVLAEAEGVVDDADGLSAAEVMARLGRPGQPAEGAFAPDTYHYTRGATALQLLDRAAARMDAVLAAEWAARTVGLPLATPQEALVLASIVEKESGWAPDRPRIAAVFLNRLRRGMPLQSDPTVIHALGAAFDGDLRREHLRLDSPYNTYRVRGLPPAPIAAPGRAALRAVLQPAATDALYFVGRGDGTSAFSRTLEEHNAAVRRYQLQRRADYRSAPPDARADEGQPED